MKNVNVQLPADPLNGSSIKELGAKLRNGAITCFELFVPNSQYLIFESLIFFKSHTEIDLLGLKTFNFFEV